MALHINKDRTNDIDLLQSIDDILPNTTFEIVNKVYKHTLGSQIIEVKPFVMKVDYLESL